MVQSDIYCLATCQLATFPRTLFIHIIIEYVNIASTYVHTTHINVPLVRRRQWRRAAQHGCYIAAYTCTRARTAYVHVVSIYDSRYLYYMAVDKSPYSANAHGTGCLAYPRQYSWHSSVEVLFNGIFLIFFVMYNYTYIDVNDIVFISVCVRLCVCVCRWYVLLSRTKTPITRAPVSALFTYHAMALLYVRAPSKLEVKCQWSTI